mmetsp:Transcript_10918/g.32591  ORF Transcript_10918/g.32591 Transcript_10918/m.32591 type:complete len:694 (-) Transcript_10918:28-2109(-)
MASKKKQADADAEKFPLNINIGIMGHVDSGKTSLVKALSTTLSTASLDKAPQSQARGITLDLGFSSFRVPVPEQLKAACAAGFDEAVLQYTLVDCPGHASLIRTIIGGAQIIDLMVLVVDANKGIQTQTAECLVIGEITTEDLVIALNKVDTVPAAERDAFVARATERLRKQLASSKFRDAPIVPCAAAVGGEKVAAVVEKGKKAKAPEIESLGLDALVETLRRRSKPPRRDEAGPFFFAVDHCFPIRGQGTVVTGTALRGHVKVNDVVELPEIGLEKKVKSMQMFRRPVRRVRCGDRAGLCLSQLDAAALERGVIAAPGSVPGIQAAFALVRKVRFFRGPCDTERKFHVTTGHATTLATAYFFGAAELAGSPPPAAFDFSREYAFQEKLAQRPKRAADEDALGGADDEPLQWCLLRFEGKVRCQLDALVIGSNLEADALADKCRVAFHGRLVERADERALGANVKLYKLKRKSGAVAKLGDPCPDATGELRVRDVVGKDLFAKETNMNQFVGLKLQAATGEMGALASAFGKSGKFKASFEGGTSASVGDPLYLVYKKYVFSPSKALHQDGDCVVPEAELDLSHKKKPSELPTPPVSPKEAPPPPKSNVRRGRVERLKGDARADGRYETVIAEGFFGAEEDQKARAGAPVVAENGDAGTLAGPFGKAGKSKVEFSAGTTCVVGDALTLTLDDG